MNLANLPTEVLLKIARDLDARTAIELSQTSKRLSVALDDNDLWKYYLDRDYSRFKQLISPVNNRNDFMNQFHVLELHQDMSSLQQFVDNFSDINRHDGEGFHYSFGRALRVLLGRYIEAHKNKAEIKEFNNIRKDFFKIITDSRVQKFDDTVFTYLTRRSNTEACLTMIKAGVDVDEGTRLGGFPLAIAAFIQNMKIFRAILAKKPKLEVLDGMSESPLCYAAEYGNMPMLFELLAAGADPNFPCFYGSPLYMAANSNQSLAVETLYFAGAKVNTYSKSHYTPLMGAASSGSLEMVIFLIRAGAYLEEYNDRKMTALDIAQAVAKRVPSDTMRSQVVTALKQAEAFHPVRFALRFSQNKSQTEEFKKQYCGNLGDMTNE